MRRIKNSVKAIIISAVACVCVLAIVLGCIFGLKKKDDEQTVQPPLVPYGFTEAQKKLASELNLRSGSSSMPYSFIEGEPYKGICRFNDLIDIDDNFFMFNDSKGNSVFYVYKKIDGVEETFETKELTKNLETEFNYFKAIVNKNDYVMFYASNDEDFNLISIVVFNFSDFDNPVEVLKIESSELEEKKLLILPETISFTDNYVYFASVNEFGRDEDDELVYDDSIMIVNILPLTPTKLSDEELNKRSLKIKNSNMVGYFNGDIIYCENNKINYVSFKDGNFLVKPLDVGEILDTDVFQFTQMTKTKFLVSKKSVVDAQNIQINSILQNGVYFNYDYWMFSVNGDDFSSTRIYPGDDYATIQTGYYLEESYVLFKQQVDSNHEIMSFYLCQYYDKDSNLIVEYQSVYMETLRRAGDSTFLTTDRVISPRQNVTAENRFEFVTGIQEGKYEFYDKSFSTVIPIRIQGTLYGIMDVNGKLIVDPLEFSLKLLAIKGNIGICIHSTFFVDSYYEVDLTTGKYEQIENIATDSNFLQLLQSNFDGYFLFDESTGNYTLVSDSFEGEKEFSEVEFLTGNDGSYIQLTSVSGIKSLIKIDGNRLLFTSKKEEMAMQVASVYQENLLATYSNEQSEITPYFDLSYDPFYGCTEVEEKEISFDQYDKYHTDIVDRGSRTIYMGYIEYLNTYKSGTNQIPQGQNADGENEDAGKNTTITVFDFYPVVRENYYNEARWENLKVNDSSSRYKADYNQRVKGIYVYDTEIYFKYSKDYLINIKRESPQQYSLSSLTYTIENFTKNMKKYDINWYNHLVMAKRDSLNEAYRYDFQDGIFKTPIYIYDVNKLKTSSDTYNFYLGYCSYVEEYDHYKEGLYDGDRYKYDTVKFYIYLNGANEDQNKYIDMKSSNKERINELLDKTYCYFCDKGFVKVNSDGTASFAGEKIENFVFNYEKIPGKTFIGYYSKMPVNNQWNEEYRMTGGGGGISFTLMDALDRGDYFKILNRTANEYKHGYVREDLVVGVDNKGYDYTRWYARYDDNMYDIEIKYDDNYTVKLDNLAYSSVVPIYSPVIMKGDNNSIFNLYSGLGLNPVISKDVDDPYSKIEQNHAGTKFIGWKIEASSDIGEPKYGLEEGKVTSPIINFNNEHKSAEISLHYSISVGNNEELNQTIYVTNLLNGDTKGSYSVTFEPIWEETLIDLQIVFEQDSGIIFKETNGSYSMQEADFKKVNFDYDYFYLNNRYKGTSGQGFNDGNKTINYSKALRYSSISGKNISEATLGTLLTEDVKGLFINHNSENYYDSIFRIIGFSKATNHIDYGGFGLRDSDIGDIVGLFTNFNGVYINTYLSPSKYQIVDWVCNIETLKENGFAINNANYISYTQIYFYDVMTGNKLADGSKVTLYPVFEYRDYYVDFELEKFNGNSENNVDLDILTKDNIANYNCSLSSNSNEKIPTNSSNKEYAKILDELLKTKHGEKVTFTVSVNKGYLIDKIELLYFPFVDSGYTRKTIVIKLNGSEFEVSIKENNNERVVQTSDGYYKPTGEVNSFTVVKNVDNGLDKWIITFSNIGNAANYNLEAYNKDSGMGIIEFSELNETSVKASGTIGFTIKAYAVSDYKITDNVIKKQNDNSYTYSKFYAAPVTQSDGKDGKYYVWLNGICYDLGTDSNIGTRDINGKTVYFEKAFNEVNGKIEKGYVIYYSANDFQVNYNNTQIIEFTPKQSKIDTLETTNPQYAENDYYELEKYLSKLTIKGNIFTFDKLKRITNTEKKDYFYGDLIFKHEGNILENNINKIESIYYDATGNKYRKIAGYEFKIDDITFRLYLTVRDAEDSSKNEDLEDLSDNFVRYFLFSNKNYDGIDIEAEFSNLTNKIEYESNTNVSSDLSGETTVTPKDSKLFTFTPKKGYLINSITIKSSALNPNDNVILNLTLDKTGLGLNVNGNTVDYYKGTTGNEEILIKYVVNQNHQFYSYVFNKFLSGDSNQDKFSGIFYGCYNGDNWQKEKDVSAFETFYLMIAGIYDDIAIEVSTISFFEIDIQASNASILEALMGESENNKLTSPKEITNFDSSKLKINVSSSGEKIYLIKLDSQTTNHIYRFLFYGFDVNSSISIYATGEDYSYKFGNISLYSNGTTIKVKDVGTGGIDSSSVRLVDNISQNPPASYLYFKTYNSINNFFSYFRNKSDYEFKSKESKDYIKVDKNVILFNVQEHSFNLSSASYLYNNNFKSEDTKDGNIIVKDGNYYYQLDNYFKQNSWFNDTILSNIDFDANSFKKQNILFNWQDIEGLGTEDKEKYEIFSGQNGYYFSLTYNNIPGYYLQKLKIKSAYLNEIVINMTNYYDKFSENHVSINNNKIFIYVEKIGEQSFKFTFYENNGNITKNLSFIAADLTIEIFNMSYTGRLKFDSNVNSDKISSKDNLTSIDVYDINFYYDSAFTLPLGYSMPGYTFVGWGSENYYTDLNQSSPRFKPQSNDGTANTWNSSSNWTDLNKDGYFKAVNRKRLLQLKLSPDYDFYIAGGYFLTDTGNYNSENRVNENYNFWSVYAEDFIGSIYWNPIEFNYFDFSLFGIWKANTYNVLLNLNDSNSITKNGSTNSHFKSNVDGLFDMNNYSFNNGVVYPGELVYNPLNATKTNKYFVFVTFDTNDWYILINNNNAFSNKLAGSKTQLLKDFVIDRYGYTWLGWFSKQISNFKNADGTGEINLDGAVEIFSTQKYKKVTSQPSTESAFPVLNFENYNNFTEKSDNLVDYFRNSAGPIYKDKTISKFIYRGALGIFDSNLQYVYFYDYKIQEINSSFTYFHAYDLLNEYETNYSSYLYSDKYFTFFDTAIDYTSLKQGPNEDGVWFTNTDEIKYNSNSLTGCISNFRSISLYAFWETNYYNFIVDLRDVNSNMFTSLGSSAVDFNLDTYVFDYAYFDDVALRSRLNMFNPVRVGYDFVGWSFDPNVGSLENKFTFNRSSTYYLNNEMTQFLFKVGLLRSNVNQLRESDKETLGDSENEKDHYVYLFAVWSVQTFTINVSLNITKEGLINLYNIDSEFALALYNASSYVGLKQNFLKDGNNFVEIVANVSFIINFDDYFRNASFVITSLTGGASTYFSLDRLFATSAGYYLLGWLIDPSLTNGDNSYLVKNSNLSSFDLDGNLVNFGEQVGSELIDTDLLFDIEMYAKLFVTTFDTSNTLNSEKALTEINFKNASMNVGTYNEVDGKRYFSTLSSSSGNSTNFGYLSSSSRYYLSVERVNNQYYMYFINASGEKVYVLPYIDNGGNNFTKANDGNSVLTYDFSHLYFNGYIIYFEPNNTSTSEFNAFYVTEDWGSKIRIKIQFVQKIGIDDNEINGREKLNISLISTRTFTIYAHWTYKTDLNASVLNGNNKINPNQPSSSNPGLAGNFSIASGEDSTQNHSDSANAERPDSLSFDDRETSNGDDGNSEDGLTLNVINFNHKLNLNIIPFYVGRFMSEMQIKFYSYEDVSSEVGIKTTTYQKVTYIIYLKFSWNNETLNIDLDRNRSYITRNGRRITGGISFDLVEENNVRSVKISGLSKLSLLNTKGFSGQESLLKIYGYNEVSDERKGRVDINRISMNLTGLKSNVEITCLFSVQTFDVEFYNVFDSKGNNLVLQEDVPSRYSVSNFGSLSTMLNYVDSARYTDGVSSLGVALDDGDVINLSTTVQMATISVDCANTETNTYNAPYGCFVYGNNYAGQLNSADPAPHVLTMDSWPEYNGFEFIYSSNYYFYGQSNITTLAEESQSSKVLASPAVYNGSVRKSSSLYTFYSWFQSFEDEFGVLYLDEFLQSQEQTYINKNLTLFGYYYASNVPTNIQFYIWDDVSHSYTEYTQNIDEYTLQSTSINSAFEINANSLVEKSATGKTFVDDETKNAIISFKEEKGIDRTKFDSDDFTSLYLSDDPQGVNKRFIEENLINNYWFYRYTTNYVYFLDGLEKRYIKFNNNNFYYETESGDIQTVYLYSLDMLDIDSKIYFSTRSDLTIKSEQDISNLQSNGTIKQLLIDTSTLTRDYKGSNLYFVYEQKYYELKEVASYEDDTTLSSTQKGLVGQVYQNLSSGLPTAKFYVSFNGKIYFFMVSNGDASNIFTLYSYNSGSSTFLNENGPSFSVNSNNFTSINNYFFYYPIDDAYFKVEFEIHEDVGGSHYINPYLYSNICKVVYRQNATEQTKIIYFNYYDKLFYNDRLLTQRLTTGDISNFKIYTPVNQNYTIVAEVVGGKWSNTGVRIKSLPSPNIGPWYYDESYSYIGYIKVTQDDINYLTNTSDDFSGSQLENKERILDVILAYIDSTYSLTGTERQEVVNQVVTYIKSFSSGRLYLRSLISVDKNGYIYRDNSKESILQSVVTMIVCDVPLTIKGTRVSIRIPVKYVFDLINSDTDVQMSIDAIPIYTKDKVEFTDESVNFESSTLTIDVTKMTLQFFTIIANNYTHKYGKEFGDYLNFVVLNEEQFNELSNSGDFPGMIKQIIEGNNDLRKYSQTLENDTVSIEGLSEGDYVVAYYNIAGISKPYPIRVSDNIIKITDSGLSLVKLRLD